jgi:UPF0042 nucleotide-binding protein
LASGASHIAVVADLRARGFATEFPRLLREVDRSRLDLTLLFLESSDESLVRRFSETRRPHPLAGDGPPIEGIRRERELLAELRGGADLVLDTSEWSIHETRGIVYREFGGGPTAEPAMVISLVSFGFKFGIPYGTDLLFDVRFLPNPHFVPGCGTHRHRPGRTFSTPSGVRRVPRPAGDLLYLLPPTAENHLLRSGRVHRRRHRSVAMVGGASQRWGQNSTASGLPS